MSVGKELRTLAGEIDSSVTVLKRISGFYDSHFEFEKGKKENYTVENAIILSDIVVNYYTCLETIFFRISQYFENSLDSAKWHRDVLKKMTLTVPGVRERVISDESYQSLEELLRFRHFKRYYFNFNYDWDRLNFVRKKFITLRESIIKELNSYAEYLTELAEEAEGESRGE